MSTTIISQETLSPNRNIESKQFRMKSWEFQVTIMIEMSIQSVLTLAARSPVEKGGQFRGYELPLELLQYVCVCIGS